MILQTPGRLPRLASMILNGLFSATFFVVVAGLVIFALEFDDISAIALLIDLGGYINDLVSDDFNVMAIVGFVGILVLLWSVTDYRLTGATQGALGHNALKLKVLSKSGSAATLLQSIVRFILTIPLFLMLAVVLLDGETPNVFLYLASLGFFQLLSIMGSLILNKPTLVDLVSGTRTFSSLKG
ncbi:RDD family protein [Massilia glaciei]|uniref:RDD domain-containing protein n=2 Tax=Pseudomonadati TaxID=3379134 RepID=A0A2U2HC69_9BURK|nr:RDD family protein [Massilia glaciei]PWF40542.1 hypothetical protein C7C56_025840 [Massilia glaciei]